MDGKENKSKDKMVFVKGPGLYSDIGKKARGKFFLLSVSFCDSNCGNNRLFVELWVSDLLYRDYQGDQKFTLTTYTANGVAITSSGSKKGELFLADVNTQLKNKNMTTDVKVDTNSNVELQYLHEYAGISTSLGLTAKPIVNFSGVAGNQNAAFGTDISFDTATGNFTKYNAGISFTNADLIASLTLNDKGETVNASYFHTVSPLSNTAVGAEFTHSFATNENTLTIGTQHMLDPLTSVKARVDNYGKASALIQHEWRPKSLVTISGEVDTRAIEKSAKIGLAVAIKP
ncbi:voltage-dependent anion channel [Striga asiatica]|uniref:Voltage-dependent anion channel n=1 Tax=Striga asiatica TaxID=4170 RepID=A0A5A7QAK8_STRAF|nr:voltage-dependent anion channel [Striga asiatica]